jgi:signal transduction histidine kinase
MAVVWSQLRQMIGHGGTRKRGGMTAVLDREAAAVLARTAHELRQPLNAASAAFGIIRQADDERLRERACAVVERQFAVLSRLLDDLLDASRLRLDLMVLQRERCDLARVVYEVVEAVQPPLAQKRQQLDLTLDTEPVWVYADARRLRQIFSNLLSNGMTYTDAGGNLTVGLARDRDHVTVTVSDTGRGMSPNELAHVFELFERGQAPSEQGLGIGLAVARQLVEMHGGSIRASSRGPGCGSEFVVSLPCELPSPALPWSSW